MLLAHNQAGRFPMEPASRLRAFGPNIKCVCRLRARAAYVRNNVGGAVMKAMKQGERVRTTRRLSRTGAFSRNSSAPFVSCPPFPSSRALAAPSDRGRTTRKAAGAGASGGLRRRPPPPLWLRRLGGRLAQIQTREGAALFAPLRCDAHGSIHQHAHAHIMDVRSRGGGGAQLNKSNNRAHQSSEPLASSPATTCERSVMQTNTHKAAEV